MHMKAEINLPQLAADAYAQAKKKRAPAIKRLTKTLLSERHYFEAVVADVAYDAIRLHEARTRCSYFPNTTAPSPAQPSIKDAELQAAREKIRRWHAMPAAAADCKISPSVRAWACTRG